MNAPPNPVPRAPVADALYAGFLALLPRIERHGRVYFRHVKCPHQKEDALQEMRAVSWKWYVGAVAQGKDPALFVSTLASFAARHVRAGRKLCGQERAQDVLSPTAQARHGFAVGKLPDSSTLNGNPLEEALHDNTRSPVPEQVCFRCDFPCWLNSLSGRDKRVVEDLMLGERTRDVARKHGLSPARVSQLRREFREGWTAFGGDCGAPPRQRV